MNQDRYIYVQKCFFFFFKAVTRKCILHSLLDYIYIIFQSGLPVCATYHSILIGDHTNMHYNFSNPYVPALD